jgi:8-oxo-dGTP pyrophosphatase MutT (NUDIX family)
VPGGTIESGESPREAVRREVTEEAGLEALEIVDKLGTFDFDMSAWREELQERHVFWLRCTDEPPSRWRGWERDHDPPIPFEFYWVPLDDVPELHAGQGRFVPELAERIDSR